MTAQKDMREFPVLVLSMLPSLVWGEWASTPASPLALRRLDARFAASICFLVWRCMSLEYEVMATTGSASYSNESPLVYCIGASDAIAEDVCEEVVGLMVVRQGLDVRSWWLGSRLNWR